MPNEELLKKAADCPDVGCHFFAFLRCVSLAVVREPFLRLSKGSFALIRQEFCCGRGHKGRMLLRLWGAVNLAIFC